MRGDAGLADLSEEEPFVLRVIVVVGFETPSEKRCSITIRSTSLSLQLLLVVEGSSMCNTVWFVFVGVVGSSPFSSKSSVNRNTRLIGGESRNSSSLMCNRRGLSVRGLGTNDGPVGVLGEETDEHVGDEQGDETCSIFNSKGFVLIPGLRVTSGER